MIFNNVWVWEGRSNSGSFQWRTRDEAYEFGDQWTQELEDEFLGLTRATYEASVLAEFIQAAAAKGVTVNIEHVDVVAEMVKSPDQVNCWYGARGEHRFCNHTIPFYMKIRGTVTFTSDQAWTGQSLTAAALWILGYVVPRVIVAIGIAWGIYAFASHFLLNESSSTVTETWTDEQGNVHTKTETKKESGTDYTGLLVAGGLIIIGVLVVPELLRSRRESHSKRRKR
jgi:hypothetical protein